MLIEHTLLLIGIPLFLIAIGFIKQNGFMAVAGGIGLVVLGVFVLASPVVTNYEVNFTEDVSLYWECAIPEASCLGDSWNSNCTAFNQTECESIGGCSWNGTICSGIPTWDCWEVGELWGEDTCEDIIGCRWVNFSLAQCDSINITTEYNTQPLADNDNLFFGILLIFVGLFCMAVGAVSAQE